MIDKKRHIHIASEGWADDSEDAHETVVVTFPDSTTWICDFYTFKCIESIRKGYAISGGCLNGAYWCPSTPVIIVDNVSRQRIEQAVDDLIDNKGFDYYFEYFGRVEERHVRNSRLTCAFRARCRRSSNERRRTGLPPSRQGDAGAR
ncbi:hypothetical protein H7B90_02515 [Cohnella xylanilytica]|uniref:Uncharacterized protein n=1 Tax=Cohnella xylanilytica TaxID=557555 RepID=A0A841TQ37_9BACL|nr:hypothetical protein [Cohnella xylanilytica]MBB6690265.1 hypothetical protein [Cohnella xylanilytica]